MASEEVSPDSLPPVCRFFRGVVADSGLTEHDLALVVKHTETCSSCETVIGRMIHERIEAGIR